ncbi:hypothetical protein G4Z16_00985 [Streptomyces bathyalis]|uniref:Uncharacterized protein n=1 Tax=Streptomyces bathyalis TaxID=2710756 RepID=A0A7T1T2K2_9ACTN|nr:hypothetical protein [Streptomyces bathyalis]QPP05194.1 hypothetical protein G4Z16_00985 [Streptomyces bathyalis]
MGDLTPSDTPTPHDIARALAAQVHPDATPRDVVVHFTLRRLAAPRYDHRSSGGPASVIAQSLHSHLYGLPDDPGPVPTALDELLQTLTTARHGDQQHAVLVQLAEQLRNAAEILEWARNNAHWRQLPAPTWEWLRAATDSTRELADGLDDIRTAFRSQPTAPVSHQQHTHPAPGPSAVAPAKPTPPAGGRARQ